jgi:hypothetical protein
MLMQCTNLAGVEFQGTQLGDARLNQRLQKLTTALARDPSAPFPEVLSSSASLEAFYRFVNNDQVTAAGVLGPHERETKQRCAGDRRILLVQDTSECRFGGDVPRTGSGPLAGGGTGFYAHVCLAVASSEPADPLGVLGLQTYARPVSTATAAEKRQRGRKARADSESQRWLKMATECEAKVRDLAVVIHVADREADFYEFEATLVAAGSNFVIRAQTGWPREPNHEGCPRRRTAGRHARSPAQSTTPEFVAERPEEISTT